MNDAGPLVITNFRHNYKISHDRGYNLFEFYELCRRMRLLNVSRPTIRSGVFEKYLPN